jgi:uncharacterized protein
MGNISTTLLATEEAQNTVTLADVYGDMIASARIQLADGSMFAPLAPNPEAFTLANISTGLSNVCRFGGQVPHFYSVAQHSVLVAALCENNILVQKFALLHDAEEGFGLPDIPTPLKPFLGDIVASQAEMSEMIYARYDLSAALKAKVKPSDTMALAMEKRDLKVSSADYLADLPLPPRDIFMAVTRVFVEGKPITKAWCLAQKGFAKGPIAQAA